MIDGPLHLMNKKPYKNNPRCSPTENMFYKFIHEVGWDNSMGSCNFIPFVFIEKMDATTAFQNFLDEEKGKWLKEIKDSL